MKSRHRAREISLQILYQYDLSFPAPSAHAPAQIIVNPAQLTEIAKNAVKLPEGSALKSDLSRHYEHFQVPESLREFVEQLVVGTLKNLVTLDPLLEKHAAHWRIARMSLVDRSLLRMAAYEMVILKEVPPSVVIDEAIELAKEFGNEESPAFINGILDSVKNHPT
jgi:N utilization substance protein B